MIIGCVHAFLWNFKNSHLLQKAIKEFFNPIKPKDIRIPTNNQKKSIGVYI